MLGRLLSGSRKSPLYQLLVEDRKLPPSVSSFNNSRELAVRQAMTSDWSNGQTEGQVNRLKNIKRQMYGRASFELLRIRVLARSRSG